MMFSLKWTVCRVCLKDGEGLTTIFEKDNNEQTICDKIMECAGITIDREVNLPEGICKKCTAFLSVAYKFRTLCKHSDEILQRFTEKRLDSHLVSGFAAECVEELTSSKQKTQHKLVNNENVVIETILIDDNNDSVDIICVNDDNMHSNAAKEEHIFDNSDIEVTENAEIPEKAVKKEPQRNMIKRSLNCKPSSLTTSWKTFMSSNSPPIIKFRNLNEKPSHICEICGNIYKYKTAIDAHMRRHNNEKPFSCEICSKSFVLNGQLRCHMRTHTGQKPYECRFCKRRYASIGARICHERIHTGERPFKCDICDKTFTYAFVLKKHKLIHTNEKQYSCKQCGKEFRLRYHLTAHLKTLKHQDLQNV